MLHLIHQFCILNLEVILQNIHLCSLVHNSLIMSAWLIPFEVKLILPLKSSCVPFLNVLITNHIWNWIHVLTILSKFLQTLVDLPKLSLNVIHFIWDIWVSYVMNIIRNLKLTLINQPVQLINVSHLLGVMYWHELV